LGNDAKDSSADSSSSSSSSDDDDEDENKVDASEVTNLRKELTTEQLLEEAKKREESDKKKEDSVRVCGCCLGTSSNDANEIVECDSCGISVHEGCYGVPQADSSRGGDSDAASEVSAASTEPWFCEPCRAGLKSPPACELCPLVGGIYKRTDVGRWVHLVCALYTPHVAFGDPERMTMVTVFEMNYSSFGRKPCSLCGEARMARTGVTIGCDAGMCKETFHAFCAQQHGLLCEPSFDSHGEGLIADLYLAHCKVSSDHCRIHVHINDCSSGSHR